MTQEANAAVLEVLTDEELAVLSTVEPVAVTPHLSLRPPKERNTMIEGAYRSLVARGIITPPTAKARAQARAEAASTRAAAAEAARTRTDGDAADQPVRVHVKVREDVAALVALREGATQVVAMARTTATQQDYVYLYPVEDVVLVEVVSSDGFHEFSLLRHEHLVPTVLAAAIHADAADGSGEPVTMASPATGDPTPGDEMLHAAGEALLRCDLTVLQADNPNPIMVGLFSSPGGSWLLRSRWGRSDPVLAEPCTVSAMRDAVTALLDIPVSDAEVRQGG